LRRSNPLLRCGDCFAAARLAMTGGLTLHKPCLAPSPLGRKIFRPNGEGESREEWGEVAGGEAARHLPFLTPFSPRHAGREGGRGMSGVKPYCANPNESWRPLKV